MRGDERAPEPEFYITECTWQRKHGWRTPEWKLIHALERTCTSSRRLSCTTLSRIRWNTITSRRTSLASSSCSKRDAGSYREAREGDRKKEPDIHEPELGRSRQAVRVVPEAYDTSTSVAEGGGGSAGEGTAGAAGQKEL